MLTSFFIILLITLGGTFLTYLYDREDSLLARLCAGNIIGSALFGTVAFVTACFFGFSAATLSIALVITLLPLALLVSKEIYQNFIVNLRKARGKLEGANFRKFFVFSYYVLIFLLLCVFFDRAMFETKDGIFTGASNNLGDLPFHLGAIFSFTEGNNFPPENPSFAGAKFTYPFIVDLIVAALMKFGARVQDAMFVQNVTLGFSLVVLLERFTVKLTENKLAGKLAPLLLLFCGGLGFAIFFRDYWNDGRSIFEVLRHLDKDYTIKSDMLRWGNSLIVLFITQRGFLLGMPLVLIVLSFFWKVFTAETEEKSDAGTRRRSDTERKISASFSLRVPASFCIGLLAGTLPLIHVHSLFVLFIVAGFLFFLDLKKIKAWLLFGAGVCLVAVPELVWSLTGSATNLGKFIDWHFGWDKGETNFFVFWLVNLGLFIPLLIVALFLIFNRRDAERRSESEIPDPKSQILFYAPFAFIFLLSNIVKLAPWEWDNIKVLIYWYVASVPLAAWLMAHLWERELFFKAVVVVSLFVLTLAGALDVWRVVSGQINYQVFSRDSVRIAGELKQKVAPNALFLNAPTYNSAIVLTGRRSLMRYVGHLSSYGIDYEPREKEVQRIYEGSALAQSFLQKNGIEYVIISPEERSYMSQNGLVLNEEFFEKYPKIAEAGDYRVYQIR